VALVGDAAHGPSPMAGVGTGLALVGAYVLAGELAAAGDEASGLRPGAKRGQCVAGVTLSGWGWGWARLPGGGPGSAAR
jgi:2-polyprenyl-6-methoxyphenol hydroxylase-like FAD-dependent oxidoreductase